MDNKKEHLIVASRGCCKTGLYTRGLLEHLKRTDKYTYNCCLLYIYYSGYNILTDEEMRRISQKCRFCFWERVDETRCAVRFATSFATTKEDIAMLSEII
jgi:hypothetical protein